jgi:hypothetical protein
MTANQLSSCALVGSEVIKPDRILSADELSRLNNRSDLQGYWRVVGQPILRFILLAEHTGCTLDDNSLTNTRTTLTLAPLRFLM